MPSDENMALVRRAVDEILNKGNLSFVDEVIAPEYVNHGTQGDAVGLATIKLFVSALRGAFPDLRVEIGQMVAEGDRWPGSEPAAGHTRMNSLGSQPPES